MAEYTVRGGRRRQGNTIRTVASGAEVSMSRSGLVVSSFYHAESIIRPLAQQSQESYDHRSGESPYAARSRISGRRGWVTSEG